MNEEMENHDLFKFHWNFHTKNQHIFLFVCILVLIFSHQTIIKLTIIIKYLLLSVIKKPKIPKHCKKHVKNMGYFDGLTSTTIISTIA